jgi:hypothetical protein
MSPGAVGSHATRQSDALQQGCCPLFRKTGSYSAHAITALWHAVLTTTLKFYLDFLNSRFLVVCWLRLSNETNLRVSYRLPVMRGDELR